MSNLGQIFRVKEGQNPAHWLIAVANLFKFNSQLSEVVLELGESSKHLDEWVDGFRASIQHQCIESNKGEDSVWRVRIRRPMTPRCVTSQTKKLSIR